MNTLYSIKEFSKMSGVSVATLRYWDEIGVFSPTDRNSTNNYRQYAIEQIIALNFVTTLSDLGISLKTIAELRKDRDPEALLQVLEMRERQLDMELRALRIRSSIIHARQELIRKGLRIDESKISVVFLDGKSLKIWPRNEYNEGDTFVNPLSTFIHLSAEYYVDLSFPVGGLWDNLDSFVQQPSRPQNFFSIDPIGVDRQPEGEYMVGYTRGYYSHMGDLPQRMADYAKANMLTTYGPLYTVYLYEETCIQDRSQYLAQSFIAVKKPRRRSLV